LRNEIIRTREELCGKIDLNTAKIEFVREELISAKEELGGKIEQNTIKVEALDAKVDAVTTDLKAHRADTEAHHGIYRVQELKKD